MNPSVRLTIFTVNFLLILIIISQASSKLSSNIKYDSDFEFEDLHEDLKSSSKKDTKKSWILDQGSDLCQVLKCKKKELCLLEDEFTAVCVNKKEIQLNGDKIIPRSKITKDELSKEYDDDDDSDSDYYDDEDYEDEPFQDDDLISRNMKTKQESTLNRIFTDSGEERLTPERTCTPCPPLSKPVVFTCGTDNRTYSSQCRMIYHNCVHRSNVTVNCNGFCPCKDPESSLIPLMMTREEKLKLKKKKFDQESSNDIKGTNSLLRFNRKYKDDINFGKYDQVKTFNGIPEPPQPFNYYKQKYKEYSNGKPIKKVSFENVKSYNDVVKGKNMDPNNGCSADALDSIGNRLLDWFSVIRSTTKTRKEKIKGIRKDQYKVIDYSDCKAEVNWMFDHLNLDSDNLLSLQELFNIKNDQSEKCIKPFLDQCDIDGDLSMNRREWCNCFKKSSPPCTAIREHVTTGLLGGYVPQCDITGYYKPIQCHSSIGLCWCVDKHGIEYPSTRTRGKPNCGSYNNGSGNGIDTEDSEDDDDTEGSGDAPLDE